MADEATAKPATWPDVVAHQQAALMSIGNNVLNGAQQSNQLLANMFAVRGAQSNPVEANSINALNRGDSSASAIASVMANALAAIASNLAHITPSTAAPPTQAK